MKNILFNKDRYYLSKGVQKIEIEEQNIEFIGGLAVVKAQVYCYSIESCFSSYKRPKMYVYSCEGIINENYEEVFLAKNESDVTKYLMFREENKRIIRFGTNDFIVEHLYKEQGLLKKKYIHLKLIYNKCYLIKESLNFSFSSIQDTVLFDYQFYKVSASKFCGPKFTFLQEDENKPGEFTAVDKVKIPIDENRVFPMYDVLTYRINSYFQLTSYVYSLLEGRVPIFTDATNVEEVRVERKELLQEKKRRLENIVLTNKRNVHTSLSNIIIQDNQFYHQSSSQPFGPKFTFLQEDENKPGEFIVVDTIKIFKDQTDFSYSIVDYLLFRMNIDFQIISEPYSLLEESPISFSSTNYDSVRKERIEFLLEKRIKWKETISSLKRTRILK